MRTIHALKLKAQEIAKQYWGLEFNLPIQINSRLSRTLGRYQYRTNKTTGKVTPVRVQVSDVLLTKYNDDIVEDVLKHELCHWALSVLDRPFKDGEAVFEKELRKIGAKSTHTIPYIGEMFRAVCSKCQKLVIERTSIGKLYRYTKMDSRYRSKCCKAAIVYGGSYFKGQPHVARIIEPVTMPKKEVVASTVATQYKLESPVTDQLVIPGPRGVTNKQMIPAIIEQINVGSSENLKALKFAYPSVFESSTKYLGKHQFQFQALMTGA